MSGDNRVPQASARNTRRRTEPAITSAVDASGPEEADLRVILDAALLQHPPARKVVEQYRKTIYAGLSTQDIRDAVSELAVKYRDVAVAIDRRRLARPPSRSSSTLRSTMRTRLVIYWMS